MNDQKLRVAFIEPVGGHGGMDYYDVGLCAALGNEGVDVTLYTCDETAVNPQHPFKTSYTYQSIYGSDPTWRRGLRYLYGTLKTLYHAKANHAQISHFHFFHIGPLEFCNIFLAWLIRLKVIVTAHDIESFVSQLSSPVLTRWVYRLATHVITHNALSKQQLATIAQIPERKITIIPHGNYLHALRPLPSLQAARVRLNLPQDANILLFFGQIKEVKGLDILLQAMPALLQQVPNTYLIIAGRVWKDDFAKYEKIIQQNQIEPYCRTYIHYIPNEEVATFYAAADLVVLPYRKIYQSGVLLMAMSYCKPVLASDLDAMKQIIEHDQTGFLFPNGSVAALSATLVRLLMDKERLYQIARLGFEYIQKEHGWDTIGQQTMACYQQAVAHAKNGR